jgi:ribosomal protein S4
MSSTSVGSPPVATSPASPVSHRSKRHQGAKKRHRRDLRGNRQLNHASHIIAIAQISHHDAGHACYERRIEPGKTKKEAMHALKRRLADVVYRALVADSARG